jgi:hypothetical protein
MHGRTHALIETTSHARGANAAPQASSPVDTLTPTSALLRLGADPRTRLMGSGEGGVVGISAAADGRGWLVTSLGQPTGMWFATSYDAVRHATRVFGVDEFTAFSPAGSAPLPAPTPTPTIPRPAPIPVGPGIPGVTPQSNPWFPMTATEAAVALSTGGAGILEGIGADGRVLTLYNQGGRLTGASQIGSTYRPPEYSGADEIGGRNQWGEAVVRTPTTYRGGAWVLDPGPGNGHFVASKEAGLDELVGLYGVTSFRVPPPAH